MKFSGLTFTIIGAEATSLTCEKIIIESAGLAPANLFSLSCV
jgi:hypothetical protein